MKYNNKKTVKFRGGEEPIQPAIQPPITIGEPTNIQSGEQSPPSEMDQQQQQPPPPSEMDQQQPPPSEMDQQQQPPSEMGPSEMDQQQPPPSEMGPSEMDQQQPPPSEMGPSEMGPSEMDQQQPPPSEMGPSEMDQQQPPSEMGPSEMDQQPSEMGPSEMDQQQEQEDEQLKEDKPIIPVEPLLPPSSEEESEEIAEFRKKMEDPTNKRDYFYINTNISTELNKDKRYKREGVLHFTDSISIKSNTTIGSLVGQTSLENVTYDKLRNTALKKVDILLGENRRCYNTHIEFERNTDTVFIHIYGTLYVKKSL